MDCHAPTQIPPSTDHGSIALVGHHNVGKLALFQQFTGRYVTVSNYPGTTVEITRGSAKSISHTAIADTPEVVTLPARTEDEQATARLLLCEAPHAVVQVGDAKNQRRTLLLTVQLAEMGTPLVLALNTMDEAQTRGVALDHALLAERLGPPVVPTVAPRRQGVAELERAIAHAPPCCFGLNYPAEIEAALALMWLNGDEVVSAWLRERLEPETFAALLASRDHVQLSFGQPLSTVNIRAPSTSSRSSQRLCGRARPRSRCFRRASHT